MNSKSFASRAVTLLGSVSFVAVSLSLATEANAIVAKDSQSPAVPVTFLGIPSAGGPNTTLNLGSGILADGANTMPYVGFLGVDASGAPFNLPVGFAGSCTAAIINPRMVLSAAHCFNNPQAAYIPETTYGVGGTLRSAMSFSASPTSNNAFTNWLNVPGAVLLNGQTSNGFTDIVSVRYAPGNQDSLGANFLQADISVITLGTPVTTNGFTPILMSPLDTNRDAIIAGFGRRGSGTAGHTANSTVRRIAENNVGGLLSLDDQCTQIFGIPAGPGCQGDFFPQDLYFLDFDSTTTSPGVRSNGFDFDVLTGAELPKEAISAPGDSGGSLFVTINGKQVSLGPLSGGQRFFGGQPPSSYGGTSFYQPAYLYGNWLASVNPYRYMVANAGNVAWNSAATWTEFLDPNFLILSGGNLVNGLPASDIQLAGTDGLGVFNDGSNVPANNIGSFSNSIEALPDFADYSVTPEELIPLPGVGEELGEGGGGLDPQIAPPSNTPGAPRAPGSVIVTPVSAFPNNINGTNTINGRYFDVTLRNAGTVTLSGISPTIDKLTIVGASSKLQVDAGSTLTSLISPELWAGNLTVNGGLTSANNIWQLGGTLQGTGTLTSGVGGKVISLAGIVAPGNSIGTLNVVGAYALGALATTVIEVDANAADKINVTGVPGTAEIDGALVVQAFGAGPEEGDVHRIVSSTGARTGTFIVNGASNQLGGIFNFATTYGTNFVDITITAASFCSIVTDPNQASFCGYLDGLRTNGTTPAMDLLLNNLMDTTAANLPTALASLNPTRENGKGVSAFQLGDILRMQFAHRGSDGTLGNGSPGASLNTPAVQIASIGSSSWAIADAALAAAQNQAAPLATTVRKGWGLFGAGDYAEADTDNAGGTDKSNASALTAGFDHSDGQGHVFGLALSSLSGEVDQSYGLGGETTTDGTAITGYAAIDSGRLTADVYASYGWLSFDSVRTVNPAPMTFVTASGATDGVQKQVGATLGYNLMNKPGVSLGAVGGLYYMNVEIDGFTETGAGGWSVVFADRTHESFKGQLGLEASGKLDMSWGVLRPFVRVQMTHEFGDENFFTSAAFSAAPASPFTVSLPTLGDTWATGALGMSASVGNNLQFYARYQADVGRDGQDANQVSVAARFGF